jgi:hypothetical protein
MAAGFDLFSLWSQASQQQKLLQNILRFPAEKSVPSAMTQCLSSRVLS